MKLRNLAEAISFALFVWFLYMCWPPLAAAGGAAVLFAWANFTKPSGGRVGAAIGAALAAARKQYSASKGAP